MPVFTQYGNAQRVGFALVCIGFFLCFVGSVAPNWLKAENLGAKAEIGIWWYCLKFLDHEKCDSFYSSDDNSWIQMTRFAICVNGILGFICMTGACCRCLCCSGGRTITHGIFAFIAGVFGFAAVGIFGNNTESLLNVSIANVDYDWGFSIFILGSIMTTIASLLLCFGQPRELNYGVVMAPNPGVMVNVSNSTSTQYNQGPVQFNPLPYPNQAQAYGPPPAGPNQAYGPPPAGPNQAYGPPPAVPNQAYGGQPPAYDFGNPKV